MHRSGHRFGQLVSRLAGLHLDEEDRDVVGVPRMAQVRAAEDSTLDVLFREDFLALLQTHSHIASKLSLELARMMGERLRQSAHSHVL